MPSQIPRVSRLSPWLAQRFRDLPIRYKLLLTYSTAFSLLLAVGGVVAYVRVRDALERSIEAELAKSTDSILSLLETSLSGNIRSYLRGVAEQDGDIVRGLYERGRRGEMSEAAARAEAARVLLSQRIGKTGYVCCLDSRGFMRVHPSPELVGRDLSDYAFVRELKARKRGYMEYEWRNPGEPATRPKAMYMAYFEPWDWIILASSYRDEFNALVNLDAFRESILALKFGRTGYSYIVDTHGNLLVHPRYSGARVHELRNAPTDFYAEMLRRKSGKLSYRWRDEPGGELREKLVLFKHLPELDWIVASTCYTDEIFAPLAGVRNLFLLFGAVALPLLLVVTFQISSTITRPLQLVTTTFSQAATGDFSLRLARSGKDEPGRLAHYFNGFMAKLEEYRETLNAEIAERRQVEEEVIRTGDQERAKISQELHDDLAPHLIGVQVLSKVLAGKLEQPHRAPDDSLRDLVGKIRDLIGEAIQKTRLLSRGLYPVHLADYELEFALRELASQVETIHGVPCDVRVRPGMPEVEPGRAMQLYYVAREAVQNAVRHGAPARVSVEWTRSEEGSLVLSVEDDGEGFETARRAEGMGLRIMRYRAALIGGAFSVESRAGKGTRVSLSLPVPKEDAS